MAAQPAATSATAQAEAKQVRDEWLETDLGKLETWDRRHRVDLQAFEDNPDDPGEVWYGEEAHEKTLEFILDLVERSQAEDWPGARLDRKTSRLGDFGCGNALMTVDVVKQGWVHCVGLDYSSEGIDLAAAVLRQAAADREVLLDARRIRRDEHLIRSDRRPTREGSRIEHANLEVRRVEGRHHVRRGHVARH